MLLVVQERNKRKASGYIYETSPLIPCKGRFDILSLSGAFTPSENGGAKGCSGGMSVSLAGPDGRVLGGGLAGDTWKLSSQPPTGAPETTQEIKIGTYTSYLAAAYRRHFCVQTSNREKIWKENLERLKREKRRKGWWETSQGNRARRVAAEHFTINDKMGGGGGDSKWKMQYESQP
ncbi:protein of unknown function DUF296 [Cynara cardunculus var. scolymus]|uniref:AT-hook motif nuclear-localized protein n=1 Tax=Cynara cardunculus var. scolymus TaxID=59895 RepID=A0A103YKX3_CYNCS|nr:protein of unknown function DUF296 [Cynara cardunculus var. scolymus]